MNMKFLRAGGLALLSVLIFVGAAHAAALAQTDVGGGALSAPVAQGNYLYVGTGATLTTWNMTDPTHPVVADRTNQAASPGPVGALAMVGGYLYAAWNTPNDTGGITIYSLADPAHPLAVAEVDNYIAAASKRPRGLAAAGNYVYVGDIDNGLVVLDASNPLAPAYVGKVGGIYEFDAMGVYGSKLLTSGQNFLFDFNVHVIDISNPAAPVEAGTATLDGTVVQRAVLTDGYAIGVGYDLMVYDLRDPANITKVFDAPIALAGHAIRAGNVLYVAGASGIQVWDFTTPSAPTLLRTVAMDAFAPDQAAATPFGPVILTYTDRGLVLGVSDPLNPVLAASFTLPFGVVVEAADFDASHAYFAEYDYGLGVFDATTLASLGRYDAALPATFNSRSVQDVSVDSGRAYVAAFGYGVLITSLADPANPTELGRFAFPHAIAIEAHGNHVYVASTPYAGNGSMFKILDVSNPANPQQLGSLTTSSSDTTDLTVRGNYAYIGDDGAGLLVVDVSNPAAPLLVGQYTGCAIALGVDVSADGNTAYVACDDGSLHIVNTSSKASPVLLGSVMLPGSPSLPNYNVAHAVIVVGTGAYVANEYGVDEVDVTNPSAPVRTARHEIGYFVSKLALAPDGRIFAFAQEAGTYVFAPITDRIFANGFD